MAAPHTAGAVALVLSRTAKGGTVPGGDRIASALRRKTQNYSGRWDRGQGYGVIDVTALLAAFDRPRSLRVKSRRRGGKVLGRV